MDGLILSIGLVKFNSVCCRYDPVTTAVTFRPANQSGRRSERD